MRNSPTFGRPEILPEDIEFDVKSDLIGKGSYGSVYRARCRGVQVAVKIPKEQSLSSAALEEFKKEVNIMSINSHANVVRLMGACTTPGKLQIVTERCYGDVEDLLSDTSYNGTLCERVKLARDTAAGMNWLHKITGTIHGDLKPANLLLDINGQVKIADFGFSQIKQAIVDEEVVKGSVMWMAPEKMKRVKPITEKIDVFSFGIILWELITKRKPYIFHKYASVKEFCEKVCFSNERPPLTADIPPELQDLLVSCWNGEPKERCSFSEIASRLNNFLADNYIATPSARTFWKTKIMGPGEMVEFAEYTDWSAFFRLLCEEIGRVNEFEIYLLKDLLVEKMKVAGKDYDGVTMVRFNQVEKWFGPFYVPGEGRAVISQMNELAQQPWFHGYITRQDADLLLKGKPLGTFLIRLSTAQLDYPFAVSFTQGHLKLKREGKGISAEGKIYPSLDEYVKANEHKLITPCPKAPKEDHSHRYVSVIPNVEQPGLTTATTVPMPQEATTKGPPLPRYLGT